MFAALLYFAGARVFVLDHEERSFVSWMREHNTFYTGDDYQLRLGIFLAAKKYIQNFKGSFKIGLNKFSCLTPAEYRSMLNSYQPAVASTAPVKRRVATRSAPEELDWRVKGAVTPVQDQGSCGSCWAFSAIVAQEGVWAAAGNSLLKLSEQNLVDCTTTAVGCHGGLPELALAHAIDKQGGKFMLADDYPYKGAEQICQFDESKGVSHISHIEVYRSEEDLFTCVAELGPTSICFDASTYAFQSYTSGIFNCDYCGDAQNHAIAVVGYGVEDGTNFWIVKNSWGTNWGEQGYIRIIRGPSICGIGRTVTAVTEL